MGHKAEMFQKLFVGRKSGVAESWDDFGRKRHIVVDSQGLLIGVLVTQANASERLGAVVVLHEAAVELSKLEVVWVDQGYSGENFAQAVKKVCKEQVRVEVISKELENI